MIEFGAQLPRLRRRLKQDLALPGLPKNKVLAAIVRLLDETLIRVGNEEYARTNKSYGLTTLRDHHVKFLRDGRAFFSFRGKSGRVQEVVLDDRGSRASSATASSCPVNSCSSTSTTTASASRSTPAW